MRIEMLEHFITILATQKDRSTIILDVHHLLQTIIHHCLSGSITRYPISIKCKRSCCRDASISSKMMVVFHDIWAMKVHGNSTQKVTGSLQLSAPTTGRSPDLRACSWRVWDKVRFHCGNWTPPTDFNNLQLRAKQVQLIGPHKVLALPFRESSYTCPALSPPIWQEDAKEVNTSPISSMMAVSCVPNAGGQL